VSKYKKGTDVPNHVIINRLNALSDDVTKGITRNFGMSIPARLDYDADLVLSIAARRLARVDELQAKQVKASALIIALNEQVYDCPHLDEQVESYFSQKDQG
jgi:hypothetical protein